MEENLKTLRGLRIMTADGDKVLKDEDFTVLVIGNTFSEVLKAMKFIGINFVFDKGRYFTEDLHEVNGSWFVGDEEIIRNGKFIWKYLYMATEIDVCAFKIDTSKIKIDNFSSEVDNEDFEIDESKIVYGSLDYYALEASKVGKSNILNNKSVEDFEE